MSNTNDKREVGSAEGALIWSMIEKDHPLVEISKKTGRSINFLNNFVLDGVKMMLHQKRITKKMENLEDGEEIAIEQSYPVAMMQAASVFQKLGEAMNSANKIWDECQLTRQDMMYFLRSSDPDMDKIKMVQLAGILVDNFVIFPSNTNEEKPDTDKA